MEAFEEYIRERRGRTSTGGTIGADENDNDDDDDARGNLFFGWVFGVFGALWKWLRFLLGCTLGISFLGPSDCVCRESALRSQIAKAVVANSSNPGGGNSDADSIPLITLCAGRRIGVSTEIDVTDRAFILTCQEEKGAGDCSVSGRKLNRLFVGAPAFASFFDVTLLHGNADADGGGDGGLMRLTGGTTTLARTVLRESVAGNAGGALHLAGGTLGTTVNLLNCTLADNVAGTVGGAIAIGETATRAVVQFSGLQRSRVSNNRAALNGGCIAVTGGNSNSNNRANAILTEFFDNVAQNGDGGCFFLQGPGARSELGECYFLGNAARGNGNNGGNGGAVFATLQSTVRLDRVSFVDQTASQRGGALAVNHSRVELDPRRSNVQVGFRGNRAGVGGGASGGGGEGNDIAILDDDDPNADKEESGSNIDCKVVVSPGDSNATTATTNRILFCDGVADGIYEATTAANGTSDDAFDNTNCDTEGRDGALDEGNLFCL